jgi:alpha-ketoglutarate-dependent taurine dioxygenase
MGYETINVTPVTPRIGAEVDGLTLAKPLSNRQVEELHQALAEHPSGRLFHLNKEPNSVMRKHSGPTIVADIKFCYAIKTDDVFGTHSCTRDGPRPPCPSRTRGELHHTCPC